MRQTSFSRFFRAATLAAVTIATVAAQPARASEIERFEVTTRPIRSFHISSDQKLFGPLEFVGGMEMVADGA